MVRRHLALLEKRCHQTVSHTPVRHTLAHGVDLRVIGLQSVIDYNAAIAIDASRFGQGRIRTYTDSHNHQVRRNLHAILEPNRSHAPAFAGDQSLRHLVQKEFQPTVFKRLLQHLSSRFVKLALKQPPGGVHHSDIHAAQLKAVGRLQTEQAAADDHCVLVQFRRFDHFIRILDVAIRNDTRQLIARNRQHERC